MLNLNLKENETLINTYEDVLVKTDNGVSTLTISLTNKRVIFFDYLTDTSRETLRIARGVDYIKYKEELYSIYISDIKSIDLQNNLLFFNDQQLIVENEKLLSTLQSKLN